MCNEHVTYTVLLFHDLRIRSELGAQSLCTVNNAQLMASIHSGPVSVVNRVGQMQRQFSTRLQRLKRMQ